jgi:hypothetical protein
VQDTQPFLAGADSISGFGVGIGVGRCRAPRAGCLEQISLSQEPRITGRRPAGPCQLISGAFLISQSRSARSLRMVRAAFRCVLRRASTVAAAVASDASWARRWDE